MKAYAFIAALALAGCAGDTVSPLPIDPSGVVARDLKAAADNLQRAVDAGILKADDPAPQCLASVVADLQLDGSAEGFTPQRAGLISVGSILYIRHQQARELAKFQLPAACDAIVGRLVIDSAKAGARAVPGAGLLLR